MGKLIIPKSYVEINSPIIFLAGPIKGAPNWQDEAAEIIFSKKPNTTIASPRWGIRDKIEKYVVIGIENYFQRTRAWERHYLEISSKNGAIMFWLPKEENHNCQKVYGAMTRLELGQWMTRYSFDKNVRFCVGSDGFSEINTIAYDLSIDAPDISIKTSLEETCNEAIKLAYKM
jgi:hypothetical protein